MSDPDLVKPSVDPDKKLIGLRDVTAVNEGTPRTVTTIRQHTVITDERSGGDTGPTPLETVLAALTGCEGAIIHRVAEALGFKYSGVDMECTGEVDARGSRGVQGVRPYFNWVRLKITLHTDEPEDRVRILKKNVETRCPVMNLMVEADVDVKTEWVTAAA